MIFVEVVGEDTIVVRLSFILPLPMSLSSIIDDCQGKIKRFSLVNRLAEDKKDVVNGKNTAIIFIALRDEDTDNG